MSAAFDEATLGVLRLANPFDDVARPQHPDGRFLDVDVDAVLREPREHLLAAIDAYRLKQYSSFRDLPPSRVLRVLGDRGTGKTHLLEAVLHRADAKPQLVVTRETENYDGVTPFEEYLFQLLIRALLSRHPVSGYGFFESLAAQLTRKILIQTLRELGPTDRLHSRPLSRWQQLCLLWWGGGETISRRFDELADDLEEAPTADDLVKLAVRHQLDAPGLGELALARLSRCEPGDDTPSVIRRELYAAMVRAALMGERDALRGFLEADYLPPGARTLYRADVVRHLLHALVEACALVRLPVIFAFDNLEGLLAPSGALDPRRAAAFLDGLAQAVDHTRGFLFVLFFEAGLYLQARQQTGTFAVSRLDLGVQIPGRPLVSELELRPPTADEVRLLVMGRMQKVKEKLPNGERLPDSFPFAPEFVEQLGSLASQPIRGRLEGLRNEYSRIVFGHTSPERPTISPPPRGNEGQEQQRLLARLWDDQLTGAGRSLEACLPGNTQELTRGLGLLLHAALPLPYDRFRLEEVQPALTVGDDPRYGFASLLEFAPTASEPALRVAVGFLLAGTKGMALDLQAKFAVFSDERAKADRLVVLWLTTKKADDLTTVLPTKTREVWQEAGEKGRACMRSISLPTLRKILAFSMWVGEVQKQELGIPPASLRQFVHERCSELFPLVRPPVPLTASCYGN